jgi:hypothetical protein
MNDTAPIAPLSALTVTSALVPAAVFASGGVDDILARVKAEARAVKTDISTPAGRKAVASLAYKIARSKTALDDMGKSLGEDMRKRVDAINADRRRIRDELDALGDEIRAPLTAFENAEKSRVEAHEAAIKDIEARGSGGFAGPPQTAARIAEVLDGARAIHHNRDWQEFAKRAADARELAVARLSAMLAEAQAREEAEAEAERQRQEQQRIRAEQEARERREREERIAAAAAERAREEAEAKARAEAELAERERQRLLAEADERRRRELHAAEERREREAQEAADKARREQEAIEAKARAEREAAEAARRAEEQARREAERRAAQAEADRKAAEHRAEEAAAAERRRIEAEQVEQRRQAEAREADRRHRAKINGEARDDLIGKIAGITEEVATAVVIAIARGEVRHIRVSY